MATYSGGSTRVDRDEHGAEEEHVATSAAAMTSPSVDTNSEGEGEDGVVVGVTRESSSYPNPNSNSGEGEDGVGALGSSSPSSPRPPSPLAPPSPYYSDDGHEDEDGEVMAGNESSTAAPATAEASSPVGVAGDDAGEEEGRSVRGADGAAGGTCAVEGTTTTDATTTPEEEEVGPTIVDGAAVETSEKGDGLDREAEADDSPDSGSDDEGRGGGHHTAHDEKVVDGERREETTTATDEEGGEGRGRRLLRWSLRPRRPMRRTYDDEYDYGSSSTDQPRRWQRPSAREERRRKKLEAEADRRRRRLEIRRRRELERQQSGGEERSRDEGDDSSSPEKSNDDTAASRSSDDDEQFEHDDEGEECTFENCTNPAIRGGRCRKHRPGNMCRHPGCTKYAKSRGVCISHGAITKRCSVEGCTSACVHSGVCIRHGAITKPRRRCSTEGCERHPVKDGKCGSCGGRSRSKGKGNSSKKRKRVEGTTKGTMAGRSRVLEGKGGRARSAPKKRKKKMARKKEQCGSDGTVSDDGDNENDMPDDGKCIIDGCENDAVHGGRCRPHGARHMCKFPGCTRYARGEGKRSCASHRGCAVTNDMMMTTTTTTEVEREPSVTARSIKVDDDDGHDDGNDAPSTCIIDGCENDTVYGGRCRPHGARHMCKYRGCMKYAKYAKGVGKRYCTSHRRAVVASRRCCKVVGCTNPSRRGGRCVGHVAKRKKAHRRKNGDDDDDPEGDDPNDPDWEEEEEDDDDDESQQPPPPPPPPRQPCKRAGCTKQTSVGNEFCRKHRPANRCKIPGCTKFAKGAGVCISHGAITKRCSVEGCNRASVQAGVCIRHGAVTKPRARCKAVGCTHQARSRRDGYCIGCRAEMEGRPIRKRPVLKKKEEAELGGQRNDVWRPVPVPATVGAAAAGVPATGAVWTPGGTWQYPFGWTVTVPLVPATAVPITAPAAPVPTTPTALVDQEPGQERERRGTGSGKNDDENNDNSDDEDHHDPNKPCVIEGCTNLAVRGGRCRKHGAKRMCRIIGCTRHVRGGIGGGVCRVHRAKAERCAVHGCSNPRDYRFRNRVVCTMHGGVAIRTPRGKELPRRENMNDGEESESRGPCIFEGCPNPARWGGRCKSHGAKEMCKIPGCLMYHAGKGGVCRSHRRAAEVTNNDGDDGGGGGDGGDREKCILEGCQNDAVHGGRCRRHGARFFCKFPGCTRYASGQGKRSCASHRGAVTNDDDDDCGGGREKCIREGCQNDAFRGGRCGTHGGWSMCRTPGCTKYAKTGGVCVSHGAVTKRCRVDGCNSISVQGGVCVGHGAIVKPRRRCGTEGCPRYGRGDDVLCADCRREEEGGDRTDQDDDDDDSDSDEQPRQPRRPCIFEGCPNDAVRGGRCRPHGSKRYCRVPGCLRRIEMGGVCKSHIAQIKRCSVEGCEKVRDHRFLDGECVEHGVKRRAEAARVRRGRRRKCRTEWCTRLAVGRVGKDRRCAVCQKERRRRKMEGKCSVKGCRDRVFLRDEVEGNLCFRHGCLEKVGGAWPVPATGGAAAAGPATGVWTPGTRQYPFRWTVPLIPATVPTAPTAPRRPPSPYRTERFCSVYGCIKRAKMGDDVCMLHKSSDHQEVETNHRCSVEGCPNPRDQSSPGSVCEEHGAQHAAPQNNPLPPMLPPQQQQWQCVPGAAPAASWTPIFPGMMTMQGRPPPPSAMAQAVAEVRKTGASEEGVSSQEKEEQTQKNEEEIGKGKTQREDGAEKEGESEEVKKGGGDDGDEGEALQKHDDDGLMDRSMDASKPAAVSATEQRPVADDTGYEGPALDIDANGEVSRRGRRSNGEEETEDAAGEAEDDSGSRGGKDDEGIDKEEEAEQPQGQTQPPAPAAGVRVVPPQQPPAMLQHPGGGGFVPPFPANLPRMWHPHPQVGPPFPLQCQPAAAMMGTCGPMPPWAMAMQQPCPPPHFTVPQPASATAPAVADERADVATRAAKEPVPISQINQIGKVPAPLAPELLAPAPRRFLSPHRTATFCSVYGCIKRVKVGEDVCTSHKSSGSEELGENNEAIEDRSGEEKTGGGDLDDDAEKESTGKKFAGLMDKSTSAADAADKRSPTEGGTGCDRLPTDCDADGEKARQRRRSDKDEESTDAGSKADDGGVRWKGDEDVGDGEGESTSGEEEPSPQNQPQPPMPAVGAGVVPQTPPHPPHIWNPGFHIGHPFPGHCNPGAAVMAACGRMPPSVIPMQVGLHQQRGGGSYLANICHRNSARAIETWALAGAESVEDVEPARVLEVVEAAEKALRGKTDRRDVMEKQAGSDDDNVEDDSDSNSDSDTGATSSDCVSDVEGAGGQDQQTSDEEEEKRSDASSVDDEDDGISGDKDECKDTEDDLDGVDDLWYTRYHQLVEYKLENGNCNIPRSHPGPLHRWVRRQRHYREKADEARARGESVNPEIIDRLSKLDEIGFPWQVDASRATDAGKKGGAGVEEEDEWNALYRQLVMFKFQNGTCLVPPTHPGPLYPWVAQQRRNYEVAKKGVGVPRAINVDKIVLLDGLGFVWNTAETGQPTSKVGVTTATASETRRRTEASAVAKENRNEGGQRNDNDGGGNDGDGTDDHDGDGGNHEDGDRPRTEAAAVAKGNRNEEGQSSDNDGGNDDHGKTNNYGDGDQANANGDHDEDDSPPPPCKIPGCTNTSYRGGRCISHKGASICKVAGCNRWIKNHGVCIPHGAKVKLCSVEDCTNISQKAGVCSKHGAHTRKMCNFPGCERQAIRGGICVNHGAVILRCKVEGCTNQRVKSGVCIRHGAKRKTNWCEVEGCGKMALNSGVCRSHGARMVPCDAPGCERWKIKLRRCVSHGAYHRRCDADGCHHFPINDGVCLLHGAKQDVCEVTGCDRVAVHQMRCFSHCLRKERLCEVEYCNLLSTKGGRCDVHCIVPQFMTCSVEGCDRHAYDRDKRLCIAHGATPRKCRVEGCEKNMVQGGVCISHGAKRKRKFCTVEGCKSLDAGGGRCMKHSGRKRKVCEIPDCESPSKLKGRCHRHRIDAAVAD